MLKSSETGAKTKRQEYIEAYAADIRARPYCYKASVIFDPMGAATSAVDGLDEADCAIMLRELRAEQRLVEKLCSQEK